MTARHHLLHEYAHVMIYDAGAWDLPFWLVEGIAEYCAFVGDPQAVGAFGRVTAATALFNMSQLPGADPAMFPSLSELTPTYWASMVASGEAGKRGAHGIAYLSVKYLVDKVGTGRIAEVLQAVAAGESFDAALQRLTGYTVEQLDAEYRSTISRAGWTR